MAFEETSSRRLDGEPALRFVFTGNGKDYFGIWIVNLLLTIVTLGVWSAWAKVRRQRYFYGNTSLGGSAFEYLAVGKQLLLGRILVLGALALYIFGEFIHPTIPIGMGTIFLFAFPWVMNRSLTFNSRMTAWRNVRFNFTGSYGEAFVAYILMPFIGALSLGTLLPRTHRYTAKYAIENLQFGVTNFETKPPLMPFYIVAAQTLALAILPIIVIFFAIQTFFSGIDLDAANGSAPISSLNLSLMQIMMLFPIVAFISIQAFYRAKTRNIMLCHTILDRKHHLRSTLSGFQYAWIIVSNLALTVLTLGMYYPFGQVRLWQYLCDHLEIIPGGPIDEFIDEQEKAGGAFSSEFADIEGFDIGI